MSGSTTPATKDFVRGTRWGFWCAYGVVGVGLLEVRMDS